MDSSRRDAACRVSRPRDFLAIVVSFITQKRKQRRRPSILRRGGRVHVLSPNHNDGVDVIGHHHISVMITFT
jgi:hypothetical protein